MPPTEKCWIGYYTARNDDNTAIKTSIINATITEIIIDFITATSDDFQ